MVIISTEKYLRTYYALYLEMLEYAKILCDNDYYDYFREYFRTKHIDLDYFKLGIAIKDFGLFYNYILNEFYKKGIYKIEFSTIPYPTNFATIKIKISKFLSSVKNKNWLPVKDESLNIYCSIIEHITKDNLNKIKECITIPIDIPKETKSSKAELKKPTKNNKTRRFGINLLSTTKNKGSKGSKKKGGVSANTSSGESTEGEQVPISKASDSADSEEFSTSTTPSEATTGTLGETVTSGFERLEEKVDEETFDRADSGTNTSTSTNTNNFEGMMSGVYERLGELNGTMKALIGTVDNLRNTEKVIEEDREVSNAKLGENFKNNTTNMTLKMGTLTAAIYGLTRLPGLNKLSDIFTKEVPGTAALLTAILVPTIKFVVAPLFSKTKSLLFGEEDDKKIKNKKDRVDTGWRTTPKGEKIYYPHLDKTTEKVSGKEKEEKTEVKKASSRYEEFMSASVSSILKKEFTIIGKRVNQFFTAFGVDITKFTDAIKNSALWIGRNTKALIVNTLGYVLSAAMWALPIAGLVLYKDEIKALADDMGIAGVPIKGFIRLMEESVEGLRMIYDSIKLFNGSLEEEIRRKGGFEKELEKVDERFIDYKDLSLKEMVEKVDTGELDPIHFERWMTIKYPGLTIDKLREHGPKSTMSLHEDSIEQGFISRRGGHVIDKKLDSVIESVIEMDDKRIGSRINQITEREIEIENTIKNINKTVETEKEKKAKEATNGVTGAKTSDTSSTQMLNRSQDSTGKQVANMANTFIGGSNTNINLQKIQIDNSIPTRNRAMGRNYGTT